MFIYLFYWHC